MPKMTPERIAEARALAASCKDDPMLCGLGEILEDALNAVSGTVEPGFLYAHEYFTESEDLTTPLVRLSYNREGTITTGLAQTRPGLDEPEPVLGTFEEHADRTSAMVRVRWLLADLRK